MQPYHEADPRNQPRVHMTPQLHAGVQKFMRGVYLWMGAGLGVTAAIAWAISQSPEAFNLLYGSSFAYLLLFAPLIMAWMLGSRIPRMDRSVATGAFIVFAALMGAALGYIPVIYATADILSALGGTIGMFVAMSMFGWVTKKDLSGMGQFLVMALLGAIIGSLINMFILQSVGMSLVISALVAVVAAGLTAYHTQAIKQIYLTQGGRGNLAILGAFALYIDFINLFLALLRLFGYSRD